MSDIRSKVLGVAADLKETAQRAGVSPAELARAIAEDNVDQWLREPVGSPPQPHYGSHVSGSDGPTSSPEYRSAFVAYVRTRAGMWPVPGVQFGASERHVLEAGVGELGGYLLPSDFREKVLARIAAPSSVLGRCTRVQTGRDSLTYPRIQPKAADGSIYTGAFVGSWVSETPAATAGEAEPEFGSVQIIVKKARALCKISRDLVADVGFDLLSFLESDGGKNLGLVVEKAIIAGTGVAVEPLGILATSGIGTTNLDPNTDDHITNTTTNPEYATHELIDLAYSLPEQYAPNAVFVMQNATEGEIRKLVDAQGRFVWAAGFGAEPKGLLGHEVLNSPFVEAVGTADNRVVLLGDLSTIVVAVRSGLEAQVLLERYADEEQIGLILRTRLGLAVTNVDALRLGVV